MKLSIDDDPGKDTHETSPQLCNAVALKLKCKVMSVNRIVVGAMLLSDDAAGAQVLPVILCGAITLNSMPRSAQHRLCQQRPALWQLPVLHNKITLVI